MSTWGQNHPRDDFEVHAIGTGKRLEQLEAFQAFASDLMPHLAQTCRYLQVRLEHLQAKLDEAGK